MSYARAGSSPAFGTIFRCVYTAAQRRLRSDAFLLEIVIGRASKPFNTSNTCRVTVQCQMTNSLLMHPAINSGLCETASRGTVGCLQRRSAKSKDKTAAGRRSAAFNGAGFCTSGPLLAVRRSARAALWFRRGPPSHFADSSGCRPFQLARVGFPTSLHAPLLIPGCPQIILATHSLLLTRSE